LCLGTWALLGGWAAAQSALQLSSPAFAPGRPLPETCGRAHGNISPELHIAGVPAGAKSLALIVDDPDAPSGLWTHWLLWNLPPATAAIPEGAAPPGFVPGKNSFGGVAYDGPQPPSGTHRYFFHLFALDTLLDTPPGANRATLLAAMQGHVVAKTEIFGTYSAGR
jgi:Raf kinase inhibitor-like YbhB/YbcL family protein